MDPAAATMSASPAPSAGACFVRRGARCPGDVAMAGGRRVAIGEVPVEPGEEVLRIDGDIARLEVGATADVVTWPGGDAAVLKLAPDAAYVDLGRRAARLRAARKGRS